MVTLRKLIPTLCIATSLTAVGVYAATTTTPASGAAHWHHGHHHGFGPMGLVMHKLDLNADQKTRIKGMFAEQKSQFEALHESGKTNREALATTPPTDPAYPGLIQTAQNNAAARIKLEGEMWTAVYQNVLTKAQQEAVPGLVAAAQASREARMAAWKAQHPQPAAPISN